MCPHTVLNALDVLAYRATMSLILFGTDKMRCWGFPGGLYLLLHNCNISSIDAESIPTLHPVLGS